MRQVELHTMGQKGKRAGALHKLQAMNLGVLRPQRGQRIGHAAVRSANRSRPLTAIMTSIHAARRSMALLMGKGQQRGLHVSCLVRPHMLQVKHSGMAPRVLQNYATAEACTNPRQVRRLRQTQVAPHAACRQNVLG